MSRDNFGKALPMSCVSQQSSRSGDNLFSICIIVVLVVWGSPLIFYAPTALAFVPKPASKVALESLMAIESLGLTCLTGALMVAAMHTSFIRGRKLAIVNIAFAGFASSFLCFAGKALYDAGLFR